MQEVEQNLKPGLGLIGLSGTRPMRAEGNTSNEDEAGFRVIPERRESLLGAPSKQSEVSCQAHEIANLNLKFAVNVMLKIFDPYLTYRVGNEVRAGGMRSRVG